MRIGLQAKSSITGYVSTTGGTFGDTSTYPGNTQLYQWSSTSVSRPSSEVAFGDASDSGTCRRLPQSPTE